MGIKVGSVSDKPTNARFSFRTIVSCHVGMDTTYNQYERSAIIISVYYLVLGKQFLSTFIAAFSDLVVDLVGSQVV